MTAPAEYYGTDPLNPMRKFVTAFSAAGFIAYTGIAIFATLIFPPAIIVFLAPFGMIAVAFTPRGQSVPQTIIWPLILAAAALMPFWPTYIHVKLGPLPILTPPRIIFYILTLFWIMDMLASPLRRGQFRHALKKKPMARGARPWVLLAERHICSDCGRKKTCRQHVLSNGHHFTAAVLHFPDLCAPLCAAQSDLNGHNHWGCHRRGDRCDRVRNRYAHGTKARATDYGRGGVA